MRYPRFLEESGTIGFVAPAFGCTVEPYRTAFAHAKEKLQQMGYGIVLGPNVYAMEGIGISNTPQKCGEELNDAYCSKESDVLIACGGGELMCEVVPYMDFERMKSAQAKWYMGYSDNTNFAFLSATLMDTAAIYGPCAPAFGMEPWHASVQDAFDVLRGKKNRIFGYAKWEKESLKDEEHPLEPYNVTETTVRKGFPVQDTEVSGRLIGGCLDCLGNLVGTKFDEVAAFCERYREDGIIWFMEACDLNIWSIRRTIWQLKHAGWFRYVKAFLIGRPKCFGEEGFGLNQYNAVTDLLQEYEVPILMDLDIGHLPPMMPLVVGATAKVSLHGNDFALEYTWE